MATYSSPTADTIQTLIGALAAVEGVAEATLETTLTTLRDFAEARVALKVGANTYERAVQSGPEAHFAHGWWRVTED